MVQRMTGFGKISDFLTETVGGFVTANKRKLQHGKSAALVAYAMTATFMSDVPASNSETRT